MKKLALSFILHFFLSALFAENLQPSKPFEEYRNYKNPAQTTIQKLYHKNHIYQTLDFILEKKKQYSKLNKYKMSIWEAMKLLDTIVDESDPDLDLAQSYHLFQTAEALRKDNLPRWLILTGFLHDLGKILITYGEPQWAVVGDTFPLGCKFSADIILPEYFDQNQDSLHPIYQTRYGIYEKNCGFDQVHMSWGHDEYLYQVMKDHLPEEALYIIRYHSFYSAHQKDAYQHLMSEKDYEMIQWLKLFSQYDLYSKNPEKLDIESIRPYYEELVEEFLPEKLLW